MPNLPRVVMMSLWRNDAQRQLDERVAHLLGKSYPNLRWVWVVGDCDDDTEKRLYDWAIKKIDKDIEIVRHDTAVIGNEPSIRLRRLSLTANAGLDRVRPDDDYWLIHESDIRSPVDLVERFLETNKCPVAGWPWLGDDEFRCFYDTWAYRIGGKHLDNVTLKPAEGFYADSVGTVWMCHAEDLRAGVRCESAATVELCNKLRERGREIWVEPNIEVVQPYDLWVPQKAPKV